MTVIISGDGITSDNIASLAASKLTGQVADANAPSGSIIQVVQAVYGSYETISSGSSEIQLTLNASITPSSASSKILVKLDLEFATYAETYMLARLYRNSTLVYNNAYNTFGGRTSGFAQISMGTNNQIHRGYHVASNYLDSPATTSAITYYIKLTSADTAGAYSRVDINRGTTGLGGSGCSSITLLEVAA